MPRPVEQDAHCLRRLPPASFCGRQTVNVFTGSPSLQTVRPLPVTPAKRDGNISGVPGFLGVGGAFGNYLASLPQPCFRTRSRVV